MERYRFVGTVADLGGRTLERFGEVVALDPQEAAQWIEQKVALVPEDVWELAGITDAECAEWFSTELHQGAPAAFLQKRARVWQLCHDFRTGKGE